jgi:hypothetical protein
MIDPSFWCSENVAALPIARRYFFIGLFSNADDQGRLKAHPALLRSQLYPFDDVPLEEIQAALTELAEGGFITLYSVEGKDYLQIPNWWTYQRPRWARPSEHPAPEGWSDRVRYRLGNSVLRDNWDGLEEENTSADAPADLEQNVMVEGPQAEPRETTVAPQWDQGGATVGPAPSSRGKQSSRGRDSDSSRNRGSGSGSRSGQGGAARPPPRTASAAGPHRDPLAIRGALAARGVCEPTLSELVRASWVTEDLIDAWWRYIGTWKNADPHVRVASLIERLRTRRVPPPEYRQGFRSGP